MAQKVRDVMIPNPTALPVSATIPAAARAMRDNAIGAVELHDGEVAGHLGIVAVGGAFREAVELRPREGAVGDIVDGRLPGSLGPGVSDFDLLRDVLSLHARSFLFEAAPGKL